MDQHSDTPLEERWGKDTHNQRIVPATDANLEPKKRLFPSADTYQAVIQEMEADPSIGQQPMTVGVDQPLNNKAPAAEDKLLQSLLEREQNLSEAASKEVVFSPALISRSQVGIIGRGTINVIQGAYGSHKSRLAELLASLLLSTQDSDFLGFERQQLERFTVCYIDTERNLREELPFALQSIKRKAGFTLEEHPVHFRFTSIKDVERKDRLRAIEVYLISLRQQTTLHLFVLLDVVTDCVGSFNDDQQAMKLFDFIGNLCDRHDATFLLVIHQNPGTDKARGHTGTEAANKASTVMQIGFEKNEKGDESEIIKVRYLKLRRGKRPEPVYLQFDKETHGLVVADGTLVGNYLSQRKHKADADDMAERLESLLSEGPLPKHEVVKQLMGEYSAKDTTIRNRLREIQASAPPMYNNEGLLVRLGEFVEGRDHFYRLDLDFPT